MRRDYFSLDVKNVDWVETGGDPSKPAVHIEFTGPKSLLRDRLTGPDGDLMAATETDVAFRLQGHVEDDETTGVVSVTVRATGDFVLELNEDADDVLRFIRAAREYGQAESSDGRYRVEITVDGEELVTYEKTTFLVYDASGELLRERSLIPSGVEL